MKSKCMLSLFGILLLFHACSTTKEMENNQKQSGHFRLYSHPDKQDEFLTDTLIIASSNNLEGQVSAHDYEVSKSDTEKLSLKIGGVAALTTYTDILRQQYKDSLVLIDSGSFLNRHKHHNLMIKYMNQLKYDVITLGNNEFDLETTQKNYQGYLASLTKKLKSPIIASNLFSLNEGKSVAWPNIKTRYLKTFNGIKLGFIAITGRAISNQISQDKLSGLYFQNEAKTILLKAKWLRRKGAKAIILTSNTGIDCSTELAKKYRVAHEKTNFNYKESAHCSNKSELAQILSKLPPNTLQLVISSGDTHKAANMIKGVPVMQNDGKAKYLSWAKLKFQRIEGKLSFEKVQLRQPIMLCHMFLKDNDDCYPESPLQNKELVPARFLGEKVSVGNLPTI